jgi:hypothetical protein
MGKINYLRVIVGGIVAGAVLYALRYYADGMKLSVQWHEGFDNLERGYLHGVGFWKGYFAVALFNGILATWVYAAIRPRFGAGLRTAFFAGLAIWGIGTLVPNAEIMYVEGLFGARLTAYTTIAGLLEVVAATLVGAALYKEKAVRDKVVAA